MSTDPRVLQDAISDRYHLGEELGRGGMATVYRAEDLRHARSVALKVLDAALVGPTGVQRFVREIAVTGRLTHPHILPLLDSGEAGGVPYYVMPLVSGESLRDRITREGALPIDEAIRLASEVASALDFAHRQGVVHRDIKPDNILLQDGQVMVADFGIAKALSATREAGTLTATGTSIGTPAYMAPEQAMAERDVDGRADIYALGCVLYEMLCGTPPFHGASAQALIARHAADRPPSIRSVRPSVPVELERVVERAVAKVPADRFATAAEFRSALGHTTGPSVVSPAPASPLGRWSLAVAALVLLLGAAIGYRGLATGGSAAEPEPMPDAPAFASTRLAVLPMVNLGSDTADAYFALGMTDELISTLSDIAGVQVMARGAIVPYAGSSKPPSEIARELGVGSLLESSCRKEGGRLRISVRLVDGATQEQRWTQQYDRELTDVFAIQRDVAREVAQALRVTLSGAESRALDRIPSTNPEAYEAYLKGRVLLQFVRGSGDGSADRNLEAIGLLQRAVALDSNFALAHAMLGKAYVQRLFSFSPGERYRGLASASIERALRLDSTLAEAYSARADLATTPEAGWRHEEALEDYLHALALKPGLAQAHGSLGSLLFHVGILPEALRALRTAFALDPTNQFAAPRIGRVLWYSQLYDSVFARTTPPSMPVEQALVLGYLGRAREGLHFLDSMPSDPDDTALHADADAARAVLFARLGDQPQAAAAIRRVLASPAVGRAHFHHAAFSLATASALLGNRDEAVRWLEYMAREGMPAYELFARDPSLASVRDHPGYVRLMARERVAYEARRAILAGSGRGR